MNIFFENLLNSFGLLGLFLLIGFIIRAKISLFQNLFIPSSIIGGILMLILGPICLNILKIPKDWMDIYTVSPSVLIIPVVASVPLGLTFSNKNGIIAKDTIVLTFIMISVITIQFGLGFLINYIFKIFGYDFYATFGWELGMGFYGGHGMAAILGNMLKDANLPYWQISQAIAMTTSTIGIIGGIIIGMFIINFGVRKGYTKVIDKPSNIPDNLKKGYEIDVSKQLYIGKETTLTTSLDVLAFHLSLIFLVCLISYYIFNISKKYDLIILKDTAVWAYAIIIMSIIWYLMKKFKLDFLISEGIKIRISSSLTEFAIISAIASLPIHTIKSYIFPIIVMVILGFICTFFLIYYTSKKYIDQYWFEQMVATFGMNTGIFLTGILLFRICDPELKTEAFSIYSISYTISNLVGFLLIPIIFILLINYNIVISIIFMLLISSLMILGCIITNKLFTKR